MKTAIVLAVAALANSFANICLGKGMKQYPTARPPGTAWLLEMGLHLVSNRWLALGMLLLLIFLAAYLTALSWADLSFVLPAIAPAYLLTAGLSRIFLHEAVSPARWAGTFLIVAGAALVSLTYSSSSNTIPKQDAAGPAESPAGPGGGIPGGSAS